MNALVGEMRLRRPPLPLRGRLRRSAVSCAWLTAPGTGDQRSAIRPPTRPLITDRPAVRRTSGRFRVVQMIPNASLASEDLPTPPVGVDDLFLFAATFPGYTVWGGLEPCALAANDIRSRRVSGLALPSSITLLRTALFFESRREQFVDYCGFAEDPDGFAEHHYYMRSLLEAIRDALGTDGHDDEDEAVAAWLESHSPEWPEREATEEADDDWLGLEGEPADDDKIAAACVLPPA